MLQIQNLIINFQAEEAHHHYCYYYSYNFQAEEAHAVEDLDAAAAKAALAEVSGGKKTAQKQFCRHLEQFFASSAMSCQVCRLTFQALTSCAV